jgi:hypothetical protein
LDIGAIPRRSTSSPEPMKALLLAFLVLGPTFAMAKQLVVLADIALLPGSGYAEMKEPGCDTIAEPGDPVLLCVGGWSRYRLTGVTRLNGTRLKDTIALVYADPVLGGRWRLVLQRLDAPAINSYGASYKVLSANPVNKVDTP